MYAVSARPSAQRGPAALEWWLGLAALLATALIPALAKGAPSEDQSSNSGIVQTVWTVVYVLAAIRLWTLRDEVSALARRSGVLWAFVGLMVLSTMWSVNSALTFKNSIELAGTTLVAYYLVARYPLQRLLELFGAAFATVMLLSYVLIFASPGRGRMEFGAGAWSGVFQDKNNLAAAMVLAVITFSILLFTGRRLHRLFALLALVMALVLVAGSQSATAFAAGTIACTVGMAAWLWRSPRCGPIARGLIVFAVATTVISMLLFGLRPDMVAELLGRNSSLTGRTDFWPALLQAIGDRPILGYGYDAFFRSSEGTDYLSYYLVQAGGWTPYHAHDSFLQILLDAGIVGLVALVALLCVVLVRALRFLNAERGAVSAWPLMVVVYLALGSYTETYLGNYNTLEWILFAAAFLYPVRLRKRAPASARLRNGLAVAVGSGVVPMRGRR